MRLLVDVYRVEIPHHYQIMLVVIFLKCVGNLLHLLFIWPTGPVYILLVV